jgi:hypothetical protein
MMSSIEEAIKAWNTREVKSVHKPKYEFETKIREYDNTVVEAVTGIPAETYKTINLPDRIRDTL